MSKIAIIITCFNQSPYTKRAIVSLRHTTPNTTEDKFEFAVFDDCSIDDTREVVYSAGAGEVLYWCSERNMGVTHLWNVAYRNFSEFDYIAISNNDVLFTPNWCSRILGAMRKHKSVMAGPITNGPGHVLEQDIRNFVSNYEPSDDWDELKKLSNDLKDRQPFRVNRINGFCIIFETEFLRRAQDERVGEPFNPKIRNFGNENEFQARLKPQPLVVPSSFVFHYKRVTFQKGRYRDFPQYRPKLDLE